MFQFEIDAKSRKLTGRWPTNGTHTYHFVWLRYSARCPHGMANDTSVKIELLPEQIENLAIEKFVIADDMLQISWTDGLESEHEIEELRRSAYGNVAK
jgi:hypothetical protein